MNTAAPLLEVTGLTVDFPTDRATVHAVRGVDESVFGHVRKHYAVTARLPVRSSSR